ncbi:hypothetical protein ABZY31_28130 [Streptomyces sp. NPDC006529]|uniref:terpene synthase family protein n=1 Tax=Streptomyces sp. NPDC006529 TaxID=3157177 RepID=UPI00339F4B00
MDDPDAVHPEVDSAQEAANTWIKAHPAICDSAAGAALEPELFGLYVAAGFPHVTAPVLRNAARWVGLMAIFDDRYTNEQQPADPISLARILPFMMSATSPGAAIDQLPPLAAALHEICWTHEESFATTLSRPAMQRFVSEKRAYLSAVLAEESLHLAEQPPSPQEYWELRSHNGAFMAAMALIDSGAPLPDQWGFHSALARALHYLACVFGSQNDVVSAPKENYSNLAFKAYLETGCATTDQALAEIARTSNQFIEQYRLHKEERLSDAPPDVLRHLGDCEQYVHGIQRWSLETGRYPGAEMVT